MALREGMRHSAWPWLAAISLFAAAAPGDARPRYGGTLRVQMRATVAALDPSEGGAAARLLPLVFDTLVAVNSSGRPAPALALSWTHDAGFRRWEFRLRPGVRFHDGTPLAATAAVAAALGSLLDGASVSAAGDALVVKCNRAAPGLPLELARRGYVFSRTAEGGAVGTGPFRPARWEPGRSAGFTANEDYWGGRPFLDAVEVEMGRPPREQIIALEVGRAELVELAPGEARRIAERGRQVWASAPMTVIALVFRPGRAADPRLREALALSIDRAAIHNVLLGRQGEISGALLPNWLSGYAFLFPAAQDLARARRLAAEARGGARALLLGYEPGDPLARPLADRIAVNARDAGIVVQVVPENFNTDLRLAGLRVDALDASAALGSLAAALGHNVAPVESPESLYAAERALVEGGGVVPLFHLPEIFGAGARVKTWLAPGVGPLGAWRLGDVWLEGGRR